MPLRTNNYKLITIVGPTASGKSEMAVNLAKKFSGEVISADSRQVYKGMDIGTGKITKREMRGVPHHLLDVVSPKTRFDVAQYRELALDAIEKIVKNNKLPILCGGTGFYVHAIVDGIVIPKVKPDWKLRKKLEKKSVRELYALLGRLDPKRAKIIDKSNPRRLIRAIEIITKTKKPIPPIKKNPLPYPILILGIKKSPKNLDGLIKKRFFKWLKQGLLREVKYLSKTGLSWQKIEDFGIHYRVVAQYLQGKINREEMIKNSLIELNNYSKRQMTWWKSDKRIHWIKNQKEAEKLVQKFLKK